MPPAKPPIIDATRYPQLLLVMWDHAIKQIPEDEAFMLYERNAKWLDFPTMDAQEKAFFDELVVKYGKGFFLG